MIFGSDTGYNSTTSISISSTSNGSTSTEFFFDEFISNARPALDKLGRSLRKLGESIAKFMRAADSWRARCEVWTRAALEAERADGRRRAPGPDPSQRTEPLRVQSRACALSSRWRACLV